MEVSCVHYMLQVIRLTLRVHTEFCLSPSKLNPHPTSLLRDVRDLLTHANSEEEKIYECLFSAFYSVRQHIKVFCNPVIIKLIMTNKKQENKIAMQIISRTYSTNVLINCPHHHAKCQIWPETKLRKCARKSHRVTGAIHTHRYVQAEHGMVRSHLAVLGQMQATFWTRAWPWTRTEQGLHSTVCHPLSRIQSCSLAA